MTSGGPKPSGYKVRSTTRSYFAEVLTADPDFIPSRMKVVEYEFPNGRNFEAYWMSRGIYGDPPPEE
jgi:hypothetical protein